jgi:hypothetical protein
MQEASLWQKRCPLFNLGLFFLPDLSQKYPVLAILPQ